MRTLVIIFLAVIGGCPQAKVANYAPDDTRTAYKLARGEASIWDGISAEDRAAYERVERKLNERTDREAENFWESKQRRLQQPEGHFGYPPVHQVEAKPSPTTDEESRYQRLLESMGAHEGPDGKLYTRFGQPFGDGRIPNFRPVRIKEGPDC